MKTVVLALLGLLPRASQEDLERKVADLVSKLSDDSIDAREQAVRNLTALGPSALPILRKTMAKLDGEIRGRLDEAVKAIEAEDTLSRTLPPLRRVTLDHRNRPAKEALEEIARQAGLSVHFEGDVGKEAISIALKDATPLQAIDEVCRKHGQLLPRMTGDEEFPGSRHALPGAGRKILFTGAPFVNFPAAYVRHYRARITEVSLTRVNNFQGAQSTGSVQVELHWPPNVAPKSTLKFEITALSDDKGRSLLPEKKEEDGDRRMLTLHPSGMEPETQETFEFRYPEPDATKIASLQGRFVLAYPKETRMLVFEKPADSKGKSLELHGLKITLDDYQEKGTEVTIRITAAGKYSGPADAAKPDADPDSLESRLPFSYGDIEPVTLSGAPMNPSGMSGGGAGDGYTMTLTFASDKPQSLREIRIPCVLVHHLDEVKFELRDIPFPK